MRISLQIITVVSLLLISCLVEARGADSNLPAIYASIKSGQAPLLEDQPVRILSSVKNNRLTAEIYAIKTVAFKTLAERLSKTSDWCRFITLHVNIKACVYYSKPSPALIFYAGRKFYESAKDAYELRYRFEVIEQTEQSIKLELSAKEGPFGTSDYLIVLDAMQINHDVILHLSLAYNSSFTSRMGSSVYLSTLGADKVGFSQVKNENGKLVFIKGVEGIIERNVMRYFLALSVFLDNSENEQSDIMSAAWFDAIEKYPTQLHEVERADYLDAKKREFSQQNKMQQRVIRGLPVFESDLYED